MSLNWLFSDLTESWAPWEKTIASANKIAKARMALHLPHVRQTLWMQETEPITRPDINTCDPTDEVSIIQFMWREQLDCEFNCPPFGTLERVNELLAIIQWILPDGKNVWISEYKTEKILSAYDMLWYFEVYIKEEIPDSTEQVILLNKFRAYFAQASKLNDSK